MIQRASASYLIPRISMDMHLLLGGDFMYQKQKIANLGFFLGLSWERCTGAVKRLTEFRSVITTGMSAPVDQKNPQQPIHELDMAVYDAIWLS